MKCFFSFLGGALVGAAAALLLAPEKGEDTRAKLADLLRKYGVIKDDEVEALVEEISAEIEKEK